VAIEARLVDLDQCELTLEAGWIVEIERAERQLPTFARASQNVVATAALLDTLPRNIINSWDDLREIFTGNFQGMYVCPGNPWDLKGCRQKSDESLNDYIWCFSQNCLELPTVADIDVISTFWDGMMCRTLVHVRGYE
jgi:hypothetical protein